VKILIIGTSRSGTTSLINGIYNQNFYKISEPFNDRFRKAQINTIDFSLHTNLCIKSLVFQKPHNHTDAISFYKNFSLNFDKTILLDRSNTEEHWFSNINLHYKNKLKEKLKLDSWPSHDKWYPSDITKKIEDDVISSGWYEFFKKEKALIQSLSKTLKIDISLYETLYGDDRSISLDMIESWGLTLDCKKLNSYLNPKYKYLQKNPKKVI
jgi:hypothetical protein